MRSALIDFHFSIIIIDNRSSFNAFYCYDKIPFYLMYYDLQIIVLVDYDWLIIVFFLCFFIVMDNCSIV